MAITAGGEFLTLPAEVGYFRLRLLQSVRTRVNPSSDEGEGRRERSERRGGVTALLWTR